MAQWLKQSTAANVTIGPFVDSTDGVTAETALTVAQADIRLSKNGAAYAQTNNTAGATHQENGYYQVPLDSTDTGTLGRLRVAVSESGALPVWQDFMVVPANIYDALVGGSDKLQVDAVEINGDATAGANAELFFEGAFISGSVSDASPAAGGFDGDSGLSATDDFYNGATLVFTSGTLKGLARQVTDYTGASKTFAFSGTGENADAPFPSAPSDGDTFIIIGRIGT